MSRTKKISILIVEDNVPLATCLEMLLEAHGFEVSRTVDGLGGFRSIKLMDFDAILCDLVMPGLSGDQLHAAVRIVKPHLCERFIFMSGHPDSGQPVLLESGADRPILKKPFAVQPLLEAIDAVVKANALKKEVPRIAAVMA